MAFKCPQDLQGCAHVAASPGQPGGSSSATTGETVKLVNPVDVDSVKSSYKNVYSPVLSSNDECQQHSQGRGGKLVTTSESLSD